jgi:hypothetical protein
MIPRVEGKAPINSAGNLDGTTQLKLLKWRGDG